jgi:hypothetical protein
MTAIAGIHWVVLAEVAFIEIVGVILFVGLGEVEVVVFDDVLGLLDALAQGSGLKEVLVG